MLLLLLKKFLKKKWKISYMIHFLKHQTKNEFYLIQQ